MTNLFFLLAASLSVESAWSQGSSETLFDYGVYTKNGITAAASDYLGKTASKGRIELTDFQVMASPRVGCPLSSFRGIKLIRGSVDLTPQVRGCVNAPEISTSGSAIGPRTSSRYPEYDRLDEQLSRVSDILIQQQSAKNLKVLEMDLLPPSSRITIDANADQTVILMYRKNSPYFFYNQGIEVKGGIPDSQILWFFPFSKEVYFRHSGRSVAAGVNCLIKGSPCGVPGTVVAPNATINLESVLITGQVFSNRIESLRSGQVNGICFSSTSIIQPDQSRGLGCGYNVERPTPPAPPTPTPCPCQPAPRPRPCPPDQRQDDQRQDDQRQDDQRQN